DGTNFSPTAVTGDGTLSSTGVFTIASNAVGLGTDTTGSFVARIIPGNGIATTGATTGEDITHTISVDVVSSAVASASTGSFSGLEFVNGDLTLMQGCADATFLQWNDTASRWVCVASSSTNTLQNAYDN